MQLRNRRLIQPQRVVQPDDDTDIESDSSDDLLDTKKSYGPRNRIFDRRGVYVPYVNDTWAADLIDMTSREAGYILNVIDIFSRKAESVKIMSKSSESLKRAFEQILEKFGSKPKRLWTDKEAGLYGLKSWLEEKGIQIYSLNNSYLGPNTHSSPVIERFNRTMKGYMMKLKAEKGGNYNTLMNETIRDFIPKYNEKKHTTLKATPNDVYNGNEPIYRTKVEHLRNVNRPRANLKPFKVGDKVLLQKNFKNPIRGKTETTYYEEVRKIKQVKLTNPITYVLEDVEGTFYRQQLKLIE